MFYKYFVSFAFVKNLSTDSEQGFGNAFVESDVPLLSEDKLKEVERLLRDGKDYSQLTVMNIIKLPE